MMDGTEPLLLLYLMPDISVNEIFDIRLGDTVMIGHGLKLGINTTYLELVNIIPLVLYFYSIYHSG